MIPLAKGARREVEDYHLSRYACYLVAMNGDPRKHAVALAHTYFAVKTRQQELVENYDSLTEEQKSLTIRNEMKEHHKALPAAAQEAGVIGNQDYAIFQNEGYKGLLWRVRSAGHSQAQGAKENPKDTRPHGKYRACRESVPRDADRGKTEPQSIE